MSTTGVDQAWAVAVDRSGYSYTAGWTNNNLDGLHSLPTTDSYVTKFDAAGNLVWLRQFGQTSTDDRAYAVAPDSLGNVFVGGRDGADAYFKKFDGSGNLLWTQIFGTQGNGFHYLGDTVYGIVVDSQNNAYAAGDTMNQGDPGSVTFLNKYSPEGNLVWTRETGPGVSMISNPLAMDATGNIYLAGAGFLSKYDPSGNQLWQHALALNFTGQPVGGAIAVDANGNVYFTGRVDVALTTANPTDAFLAKFDSQGNLLWAEQLIGPSAENGRSVTVDQQGNVYISGDARGDLFGPNLKAPNSDAFLAKFDPQGHLIWGQQFGTTLNDALTSLTSDADGNIYASGYIRGGTVGGSGHGWLVKFSAVPEPSSIELGVAGVLVLVFANRVPQRANRRSPAVRS